MFSRILSIQISFCLSTSFLLCSCSFFDFSSVEQPKQEVTTSETPTPAEGNSAEGNSIAETSSAALNDRAPSNPPALTFPSEPSKPAANVKVEVVENTEKPLRSDIEVLWAAQNSSNTAPDGFILRYGYERDQLDFERRLALHDLSQTTDVEHGNLFRYIIKDVPANRHVYFTISSLKGSEQSTPSQIFEVE